MNINLDDPKSLRQTDTQDMLSHIADFPNQLKKGWDDIQKMALPSYFATCDRIIICGMGGSGIGGDLVRSVVSDEARKPIEIHRNYGIPNYTNRKTLIITVSHSGTTEETLDAFISAHDAGGQLFAITTGSELERLAKKFKVPYYKFEHKGQPRAALGFMLGAILAIFKKIGILDMTEDEVIKSFTAVKDYNETLFPDSPHRKNQAKQIANDLQDYLPIIYASEKFGSLALRWRGQLAENSKEIAFYDLLPAVNHNFTGGLDFPKEAKQILKFLFIKSNYDLPRIKTRQKITAEILDKKGIVHKNIEIKNPKNILSEVLIMSLLADYTSYYLSIINNVDPTTIENIDFIKQRLKELE
jgi:glucose/mannose-6-phosphate isomerase